MTRVSTATRPGVAIVGLTGSGKTVLTVVLAKHLGRDNPQKLHLEPNDSRTRDFVEHNWHQLQSGEWPASTPQGVMNELSWTLHTTSGASYPFRLVDLAGQDLQRLFANDEIRRLEKLEPQLQQVGAYCQNALIVLVAINLQDFLGEADHTTRATNDYALKEVLNQLCNAQRHVCLVITQSDLYSQAAKDADGWPKLLRREAFWVYKLCRRHSIPYLYVTAVVDTTTDVQKGEKPRRVPRKGFRTRNVGHLANWLAERTMEIGANVSAQEAEDDSRMINEGPVDESNPSEAATDIGCLLFVFCVLIAFGLCARLGFY